MAFASQSILSGSRKISWIGATDRSKRLPLSFAQQRLWFLAQAGASEAYHIPFQFRFRGKVDGIALRQSLDRIVARHEVLRTTFALMEGEPVQEIHPAEESKFILIEEDLTQHSDARGRLRDLIVQEAIERFDLERGPVFRGRLLYEAEGYFTLLITMHHIASDGWSIGIFCNELSQLYNSLSSGQSDPLPSLGVQYADYAVWQRTWIEGDILKKQAEYWKETLAGSPGLLELPTDYPRPAQKSYAGEFAQIVLDRQLTQDLKVLSQKHGTTLYMTLLTGWIILLARLSGQEDIVTGTPVANRARAEIEDLIGFFVNTLAIRINLSGGLSVSELLLKVKQQTLSALANQDIPFEQVVELAKPVRTLAHSPLFQVMFAWQSTSAVSLSLDNLLSAPLASSPHVVAKFDLTLSLQEVDGAILGGMEYATSLFSSASINRYLGYFREVLRGMTVDAMAKVEQLPILPSEERHQLLYEWNDTKTSFPSDQCVHQLFKE